VADWPTEQCLLVGEHLEIATLIADGSGDAAAAAVSRHIRGFYGRWINDIPIDYTTGGEDDPAPTGILKGISPGIWDVRR
jgi:hypothetical protein